MTSGWREAILADIASGRRSLTLVADPDELLGDERLLSALQGEGYDVVVYEDPIVFRYLYESTYRPPAAPEDAPDLVVVLRDDREALDDLPYDLLQRGRRLDFSLGQLFPNLGRNIVAVVPTTELDRLYNAQLTEKPFTLGENGTKDFVLRHVYGITPELLKSDEAILGMLLGLHIDGRQLPPLLADRLVAQIHTATGFTEWPLFEMLTEPSALLGFLQERWPVFLDQLAAELEGKVSASVHDDAAGRAYTLRWPGQTLLPFDAPKISAYIDTLFLEGKLRPVAHAQAAALRSELMSMAVGLEADNETHRRDRLDKLLDRVANSVPSAEASQQDWRKFAGVWAEVITLRDRLEVLIDDIAQRYGTLQAQVDAAFEAWMGQHYRNLAALSPHPPVMVHHIARSLARDIRANSNAKVALIVVDGLALDQWLIVRSVLQEQLPGFQFSEGAVFAWVPTITSVSRQAIFSGDIPTLGFPTTIATTAAESSLWTDFWEAEGLERNMIGYAKGLRYYADLAQVDALVSQARMRVVGLVINQVDEMMHGMKNGTKGLRDQVALWLKDGFLVGLLRLLNDHGYTVALTADHGNIEAGGIGSPNEQSLANSRGSRARIYANETLRAHVQEAFPKAIAWTPYGLPPDYWPLLAPNRAAFASDKIVLVTHGGISLEEVVVPYIRVHQKAGS